MGATAKYLDLGEGHPDWLAFRQILPEWEAPQLQRAHAAPPWKWR